MKSDVEGLHELVRAKIEHLRPKLLDLSRRNPLISTKLGPRSNAHIRAVDELPEILFFKINNEQEMDLLPLPSIEEDPRDERTDSFREAIINARITDAAYLAAMEAVDRDADDYLEKTRTIERALKDSVRAQLGLAPRVQKSEINLTQHAKNNGIVPSYELPKPDEENGDGRHTDDNIQTLLFILGVECDGATYHSAKSARDRDRLRQEILENLGWKLHRIWSTDWFNNPRQETERLRKVIGERLAFLKTREHEYVQKPKQQTATVVVKSESAPAVTNLFEPEPPMPSAPIQLMPSAKAERRVTAITEYSRSLAAPYFR